MAKIRGPDKQETEQQNRLATKGSRSVMSSLFPNNIKSLGSFLIILFFCCCSFSEILPINAMTTCSLLLTF